MDVLATDLADYLVRKGVGYIHRSQRPCLKFKFTDAVPRDTPHFWTGRCTG